MRAAALSFLLKKPLVPCRQVPQSNSVPGSLTLSYAGRSGFKIPVPDVLGNRHEIYSLLVKHSLSLQK